MGGRPGAAEAAAPFAAPGAETPGASPAPGGRRDLGSATAVTPAPSTGSVAPGEAATSSTPTGATSTPMSPSPTTWPAGDPGRAGEVPDGRAVLASAAPTRLPGYPLGPPDVGVAAPGAPATPGPHPGARSARRWPGLLAAALVGALVAAVVTAVALVAIDDGGTADGGGSVRFSGTALEIGEVLDKAQPSVVSINTDQATTRGVFGGAGSGVIISEDGLVLTNAHVIGGVTSMDVILHDGSTVSATLVGSSPDDDIAIIRIDEPEGLVPAELGSSADMEVGDEVVAIGNALNLGGPPSVTRGIVSAKDRSISAPGELVLDNLIQTDAAINPGNSGGPLLNAQGQVVGINTAIISDAQNIGFAIAIDPIRSLIDDLRSGNGEITPDGAFLGVSMLDLDEVTPSVLEEYAVGADEGAFVSDLVPDTAATEAGLELGDVIVEIDGSSVTSSDDVAQAIRDHEPGDEITIVYEREGERGETVAVLRSRGEAGG